jgi:hypothetical protein
MEIYQKIFGGAQLLLLLEFVVLNNRQVRNCCTINGLNGEYLLYLFID